jgi:hypothetical protein
MPFGDLDRHIAQFAAAALRTQEIYDEAWRRELDVFEAMVATSPVEYRDLLRPLTPSRQFLRKYDFALSAVVTVSRREGFKIQLLPLNLSYSITRQIRQENHGKFEMVVEQIPINE